MMSWWKLLHQQGHLNTVFNCWSPGRWPTCWSSRGLRWARWKTLLQPALPARDVPTGFQPGWSVAGVVSASLHTHTHTHTYVLSLNFVLASKLWSWKSTCDQWSELVWLDGELIEIWLLLLGYNNFFHQYLPICQLFKSCFLLYVAKVWPDDGRWKLWVRFS